MDNVVVCKLPNSMSGKTFPMYFSDHKHKPLEHLSLRFHIVYLFEYDRPNINLKICQDDLIGPSKKDS